MSELKPCPFCGGEAIIERCRKIPFIRCTGCHMKAFGITYEAILAQRWNRRTEVARMEYDREEIHTDCTVHILYNSETGECSIGWWRNDKPPKVIGGTDDAASV